MKTYINNGAQHVMRDGTVVGRDQIIECEDDLAKKFPMKFKEVVATSLPIQQEKEAEKSIAKKEEKFITRKKKIKDSDMVDVTAKITEFSIPDGYSVKSDKRGYWVFDGDKEPANEKPLKREEVEPFIRECVI